MIAPSAFAEHQRFVFASRRTECPVCGARRGFAPLSDNQDSGKCFACGVFLPPESSGKEYPLRLAVFTPRRSEPGKVMIEAFPSPEWSKVPVSITYDYHDEAGRVLFHVDRKERPALYRHPDGSERWEREKSFLQRPYGTARAFQGCMDGVRRVLYRLPCVLQAIRHGWPVVIVEGEKDADTYNDLFREELAYDARATCCPGGAGKWLAYGPGYGDSLRGADVIIDGDMDTPGLRHMRTVADALQGKARRIRIMPELFAAIREAA